MRKDDFLQGLLEKHRVLRNRVERLKRKGVTDSDGSRRAMLCRARKEQRAVELLAELAMQMPSNNITLSAKAFSAYENMVK
jgi:hypothetical protein